MMDRYRELEEQRRALRERLRGATLFEHKTRGFVYQLADGSYLSVEEFKRLRRNSGIWWLL
ncbi:hypothetical protein PJKIFABJ_00010 [Pseudomonas phage PE09]|uniref:Uncharacterized protein n=1 Tax=Pseudomonas phage PE09 TaxID=2696355 RepID=A0A9E6KQV5_9CAUD|nr:hypothetical protein QGX22_gp010 [Pseudomonas phage PE09]QHZ59965.1 hypothetical protein PJKIFABJ_00010 [Pseudomonas phage PE09]